jgi:carboxyl-terminal processing protease
MKNNSTKNISDEGLKDIPKKPSIILEDVDKMLDKNMEIGGFRQRDNSLKYILGFFVISTIFLSILTGLLFIERNRAFQENDYPFTRLEVIDLINENGIDELPDDKTIREGELKGLVGSLNDPYSTYFPAQEDEDFQDSLNQRYEGIGVKFETVNGNIIVQQIFKKLPS